VRSGEIAGLAVEVRRYDPHLSLDGGADGLDAYRALFGDLDRLVATQGRAIFEIGAGQTGSVAAIAIENGWKPGFHEDLAGIVRAVDLARAVR
jgi:release factor glutamine methyltransferase